VPYPIGNKKRINSRLILPLLTCIFLQETINQDVLKKVYSSFHGMLFRSEMCACNITIIETYELD